MFTLQLARLPTMEILSRNVRVCVCVLSMLIWSKIGVLEEVEKGKNGTCTWMRKVQRHDENLSRGYHDGKLL